MSDRLWFFFFQAEDGIRDLTVTGVQTCALPIFVGDVESNRVRGHDLGSQYASSPRVAKIQLKILRHKRRLSHQPAQQFAFRRRPLVQRANRNEVRSLLSHGCLSQPTGPPKACQENNGAHATPSAPCKKSIGFEFLNQSVKTTPTELHPFSS